MFEYQNAFVGGGQILDVAFIANKAIGLRKRSLRLGLVCKLDIEKTYDHVNWKFLFFVMKKKSLFINGEDEFIYAFLLWDCQSLLMIPL